MSDAKAIVERLRMFGGGKDLEAADLIERQAAEIAELRSVVYELIEVGDSAPPVRLMEMLSALIARAKALRGQK